MSSYELYRLEATAYRLLFKNEQKCKYCNDNKRWSLRWNYRIFRKWSSY